MSRLDPAQKAAVLEAIDKVDQEMFDVGIMVLEQLLWKGIDATQMGHELWVREGEGRFGDDPFAISIEEIDRMDPEWKLAYVASILVEIAIVYGVNDGTTLEAQPGTIAELLRKVNDVVLLPTT